MATVTINNSPFHSQSSITRVYGYISGSYSCGYHTGVDLVSSNRAIYPPFDGTVTYLNKTGSGSLGVQVQVIDGAGRYWRFCHMQLGSNTHLSVGQQVTTGTQIGIMGGTGNVTGDHLHLECQSQSAWACGTFYNPCEILGIPNEVGTIVNYDGTTPPVPPTISWIYKDAYLTVSEMINNANLVISYYRSQGVNDTAIAAILGNMQAESTIEPILTERGGGGGYRTCPVDSKIKLSKSCKRSGI